MARRAGWPPAAVEPRLGPGPSLARSASAAPSPSQRPCSPADKVAQCCVGAVCESWRPQPRLRGGRSIRVRVCARWMDMTPRARRVRRFASIEPGLPAAEGPRLSSKGRG